MRIIAKEKLDKYRNFDWLNQKHNIENLSLRKIETIAGVNRKVISKWMDELGVKKRTSAEGVNVALKGKPKPGGKGSFPRGEKHWAWNGGKIKSTQGYVNVLKPDHPNSNFSGYVMEHRLVMEKMIGRLLKKHEAVHHINEIKNDNRPENLFLFCSNKDHRHFHGQRKKNPNFPMKYKYDYLYDEKGPYKQIPAIKQESEQEENLWLR